MYGDFDLVWFGLVCFDVDVVVGVVVFDCVVE